MLKPLLLCSLNVPSASTWWAVTSINPQGLRDPLLLLWWVYCCHWCPVPLPYLFNCWQHPWWCFWSSPPSPLSPQGQITRRVPGFEWECGKECGKACQLALSQGSDLYGVWVWVWVAQNPSVPYSLYAYWYPAGGDIYLAYNEVSVIIQSQLLKYERFSFHQWLCRKGGWGQWDDLSMSKHSLGQV